LTYRSKSSGEQPGEHLILAGADTLRLENEDPELVNRAFSGQRQDGVRGWASLVFCAA
jgi:hypothetical protein